MHVLLSDPPASHVAQKGRDLLLVWQNPRSRRFLKVGTLTVAEGFFRFRYEPDAASDPDFFALDEFPRIGKHYESAHLPAFFANRIMSSERPSYDQYLSWLNLDAGSSELPLEMLVRTGAGRATDTFHVVEKPVRASEHFVSRFFVSGIRHLSGARELVAAVADGDRLLLQPEPDNTSNPDAYRVVAVRGEPIGWIPDWLCGEIAELAVEGWRYEAVAEKVSPDAPSHVQVLCRVEASRVG